MGKYFEDLNLQLAGRRKSNLKVHVKEDLRRVGICATCRNFAWRKTDQGHEFKCSEWERRDGPKSNSITSPVHECSEYDDNRVAKLWDMKDTAWYLRTDSKRKNIGFVPRAKMTKKEKEELEELSE